MKPIMYHNKFSCNPSVKNFYGFNEEYGYSNMRYDAEGMMYVYNVEVYPEFQGQGFGRGMMTIIRDAFPDAHIYVDTTPSSDSFWMKMVDEGIINSIRNHNVIQEEDYY